MWFIYFGLVVVVIIGSLGIYGWWVTGHITQANAITDKAAVVASTTNPLAKVWAILSGWKTAILAWIAGAVQVFSFITTDVIQGWQALPWAQVFDQHIANWITIVCAFLIPVTHAIGMKQAAQTTPTGTGT